MKKAPREPGRVLVMDDEVAFAQLVADALSQTGCGVTLAYRVAEAETLLRSQEFDVALLDLSLPDGSGTEILRRLTDEGALTECIVLTGSLDITSAIEAMKLGASDYLVKPIPLSELEVAVGKAVERHRLRKENLGLQIRLQRYEAHPSIVTEDAGFLRLIASLDQIGPTDLPVLIQGESGTGKELVAHAVHDSSLRRTGPFVALNCAAVPEALIETELFGHERGAFTGADARKLGLFEVAAGGTLFLDEVGDISPAIQARVLRVLETGEFLRLGSTRVIQTDARVVSATNKDLGDLIEAGSFREDLFYRINGVTLRLPPLRDRPGDILPLSLHFLRAHGISRGLSPRALDALKAYAWPGNVRELQMVIRRAGVLAGGELIEPGDLPLQAPRSPSTSDTKGTERLTLAEVEERHIRHVLAACKGHRARAAARLGISVKTLYNKIGPERPRLKDGDD